MVSGFPRLAQRPSQTTRPDTPFHGENPVHSGGDFPSRTFGTRNKDTMKTIKMRAMLSMAVTAVMVSSGWHMLAQPALPTKTLPSRPVTPPAPPVPPPLPPAPIKPPSPLPPAPPIIPMGPKRLAPEQRPPVKRPPITNAPPFIIFTNRPPPVTNRPPVSTNDPVFIIFTNRPPVLTNQPPKLEKK